MDSLNKNLEKKRAIKEFKSKNKKFQILFLNLSSMIDDDGKNNYMRQDSKWQLENILWFNKKVNKEDIKIEKDPLMFQINKLQENIFKLRDFSWRLESLYSEKWISEESFSDLKRYIEKYTDIQETMKQHEFLNKPIWTKPEYSSLNSETPLIQIERKHN